MLISENLDNESYTDIVKKAVNRISKIYPYWTNYNSADPGMTIIELLAWFKEVQQYHLNVLSNEHFKRYLKLLGIHPKPLTPSETYLKISGNEFIPKGTVYYADDIPFETLDGFRSLENSITKIISDSQVIENYNSFDLKNMKFSPFGDKENKKKNFKIYLKNNIKSLENINIYFEIINEYEDSQLNYDDFIPYVKINAEYFNGKELIPADIVTDDTLGFFKSGVISIKVENYNEVSSKECYIKFLIDSNEYVIPPIISSICINAVKSIQRYTYSKVIQSEVSNNETFFIKSDRLFESGITEIYGIDGEKRIPIKEFIQDESTIYISDCKFEKIEIVSFTEKFSNLRFVGNAYGFGDYRLKYELNSIESESLCLYIKESDEIYYKWKKVTDFDLSGKHSRHFVFAENENEFVFGNGEKGMPPDGKILIVSCACSLGNGGNVKTGMINSYNNLTKSIGINFKAASGGKSAETVEECFKQARENLHKSERCITFEDYEYAVRNVPGAAVKRVKAFLNDNAQLNEIVIAVETYGQNHYINDSCMKNFKKRIIPKSVIGTKITFIPPVYAKINIYAEIVTKPHFENSRKLTEQMLYDYFISDRIGFGDIISKNNVIDYIYNQPWISRVKELDISVSGNNAITNDNGDIHLKKHCLPEPDSIMIITLSEE